MRGKSLGVKAPELKNKTDRRSGCKYLRCAGWNPPAWVAKTLGSKSGPLGVWVI